MNGFKQSFVAKQIVSDNPVVKLDFIEGSLALQLAPLVSFFPFFRILNFASIFREPITIGSLNHDSRLLPLSHMLNCSPDAMRHFGIAKHHLKRFLLVNKDLTFLDLIISINLPISPDSWPSRTPLNVSILLKFFSFANLTIFTNNVDFNSANILIKRIFLVYMTWNLRFTTFTFLLLLDVRLSIFGWLCFILIRWSDLCRLWGRFWNILVRVITFFFFLLISIFCKFLLWSFLFLFNDHSLGSLFLFDLLNFGLD